MLGTVLSSSGNPVTAEKKGNAHTVFQQEKRCHHGRENLDQPAQPKGLLQCDPENVNGPGLCDYFATSLKEEGEIIMLQIRPLKPVHSTNGICGACEGCEI